MEQTEVKKETVKNDKKTIKCILVYFYTMLVSQAPA